MKNYKSLLFILLLILRGSFLMSQVTLTESNLPIITINTNGRTVPDEPKITADIRFVFNANGLTKPTDTANIYSGKVGIETRGSTSQFFSPKKPFSIELRDASGNANEVALFKGWTKIEDYALVAPYSDKSLMRDALTYHLASTIMPYAPKTRFCELTLNGNYQGVYVITENIKRKRLGISKADSLATSGDALTGGYILKIDKTTGDPNGISSGFNSQYTEINGKKTFYVYHYPKPEDIKPAQANYIKTQVRAFETAMKSDKFNDDTEGYVKYFDVSTLIDYCIMNELTKNVDGYRLSTYFFKDKNSINPKFQMGPVWDYNIALGNANYCQGGEPSGWAYQFNQVCSGDNWVMSFWWEKLFSDKKFRVKLKERWFQLRQNQLATPRIMGVVDSFNTLLSAAQDRNFKKWNVLNTYVWPNRKVNGTYPNEVAYLKDWLTQRLAWLDGQIKALKTSEHPRDEFNLEVFPNPSVSGGEVRFAYYLTYDSNLTLKIYNAMGQLVEQQDVKQEAGDNNLYWHKNAPKGLFIYDLLLNGSRWKTGKLSRL